MSRKDALILPTKEREAKDTIRYTETARAGVYALRVETQTPLDRLFVREIIDRKQFDAGNRLKRLYWFARGTQRLTGRYEERTHDVDIDLVPIRHQALLDLRETFKQVGKEYASILEAVCCEDMSPTDWAHRQRKPNPRNVAAPLMREALTALVRYWRL